MSDRDKLIELLDDNFGYVSEQPAEKLADKLIANGVIICENNPQDLYSFITTEGVGTSPYDRLMRIAKMLDNGGVNND